MNRKNSLLFGQGIFTIVVIVALGLIIVNEKGGDLFKTKASNKIDSYFETNFNDLSNTLTKEEIKYEDSIFEKKIISKKNKNLYFTIKYAKRELSDTFKKDYEEGNTLLTYLNTKLAKDIYKLTKTECKIHNITTLDKFSDKVRDRIIKEENLLNLKYYYIEKEFSIDNWNEKEITNTITTFITSMKEKEITPKYYEITITNAKEITTSIQLSNITEEFLESKEKDQIIKDILEKKESELLKNSKITVQYKN